MALQSGTAGTVKLVGFVLSPSSFSAVITLLVGTVVVGGTIILSHFGTGAQQSLLGLHTVYSGSSLGTGTAGIEKKLSSNIIFNNGVLFALWGSVGLVVYSFVQGIVNEFNHTDDVLHEIHYIHADRTKILHEAILRAVIRFGALAGWWVLAFVMLHKVFPYAIATAHLTANSLGNTHDWIHTFLSFCLCLLGAHGLTVLLRLVFLRPRLTGNNPLDS